MKKPRLFKLGQIWQDPNFDIYEVMTEFEGYKDSTPIVAIKIIAGKVPRRGNYSYVFNNSTDGWALICDNSYGEHR